MSHAGGQPPDGLQPLGGCQAPLDFLAFRHVNVHTGDPHGSSIRVAIDGSTLGVDPTPRAVLALHPEFDFKIPIRPGQILGKRGEQARAVVRMNQMVDNGLECGGEFIGAVAQHGPKLSTKPGGATAELGVPKADIASFRCQDQALIRPLTLSDVLERVDATAAFQRLVGDQDGASVVQFLMQRYSFARRG